ncbi:dual specificity protein phosphatase family protein [Acinetobacter pragensis]|uniref:Protein tyrosine phosphatase n=1 Tax=Acinetobacter pragensis TaxID=1806892 RepID=A0A151XXP5_9GAMM|nr:dual specificity protein phosphatase family protein [Acinetobacter pragensis]KYQ70409.1 protein tyrosine phosphatase [Acinetobacter pragensis]
MKTLVLALTLSACLTGCMTAAVWPDQQRPENWGTVIEAKSNFYQISPFLYRSEQPDHELLPLLQAQDIQTVINLRSRNADQKTLSGYNFQLVHIPINTWSISREDLLQVMQMVQQAERSHKKVLIHCYHGSDRTGASIAMYRIIFENWSTADALNEMKHGGYGFHPVWSNIEKLFSPENIKWIRQQLEDPSHIE